jgi:hypothetical protein
MSDNRSQAEIAHKISGHPQSIERPDYRYSDNNDWGFENE